MHAAVGRPCSQRCKWRAHVPQCVYTTSHHLRVATAFPSGIRVVIRSAATMPMVAPVRTGTGTIRPMGTSASLQARMESLRRQLADCGGKGLRMLSYSALTFPHT
jgi:hypothetical protein